MKKFFASFLALSFVIVLTFAFTKPTHAPVKYLNKTYRFVGTMSSQQTDPNYYEETSGGDDCPGGEVNCVISAPEGSGGHPASVNPGDITVLGTKDL